MALLAKWPDFFVALAATLIGVWLGARWAYSGERKIIREERDRQEARQARTEREDLLAHLHRVSREIRDNEQYVSKLAYRFDKWNDSNTSKALTILDWAGRWVDGLSIVAYEGLAASGLQRFLPDDLQDDLFDARQRTVDLITMIKASPKDTNIAVYIQAPELSTATIIKNVSTVLHTTQEALDRVKRTVFKYTAELSVRVRSEKGTVP